MTAQRLTIFYDAQCPLCSLEMGKLKRHDRNNLIQLEDIHQADFATLFPEIDVDKATRILHGIYQGKLLLALDVTHRAWTLVGCGALVAPLQLPVIKQLAHAGYLVAAKYRLPISHFLHQRFGIGNTPCTEGTCYAKTNNTDHRC